MIYLKTAQEIEKLRVSNELVSRTLAVVGQCVKPGVTTAELDAIGERYIVEQGAVPGFKGYGGFPGTLCISVNEQVVHGIPSDRTVLAEGDIVSIDCGTIVNGFYGDSAYTFAVGDASKLSSEKVDLLRVTKEALYEGIAAAKLGGRIGDISFAVQKVAHSFGMGVVRELVGHGIGRKLHEDPQLPNYGKAGTGVKLQSGMVLCLEPMINAGKANIIFEKDGWTVRTADCKPSAHFELCFAVTDHGIDVLSTFKYIEEGL